MINERDERQQIAYWLGHYQWQIEQAEAQIRLYRERLAKLDAEELKSRYGLALGDDLVPTPEFIAWVSGRNDGVYYFEADKLIKIFEYHCPDSITVGQSLGERAARSVSNVPIAMVPAMRQAYLESAGI